MVKLNTPIALLILDGWGQGKIDDASNAINLAKTPHMTLIKDIYPATTLKCSGEAVGLPDGQMGNSEVGHLNIGAGRIIYQELTRITKAIKDKDFYQNDTFLRVMDNVKKHNSALHLMGLVSDGGVHSHLTHLYALVEMAKEQGIKDVYIHAFLDGRDVAPSSGANFLAELEAKLSQIGLGKIATISGRFYAMDRDKRWERVEKAYKALVDGEGRLANTVKEAIAFAYNNGETDEFVVPTKIEGLSNSKIKANDGLIFFNFRPDRARQLTRAFVDEETNKLIKAKGLFPVFFATMTQYDESLNVPVAFKPQTITKTLGEVLSKAGLNQLRIAETEKYAHVTYFFNGGDETPYLNEARELIPSPKVQTYDLKPEMSAHEVTTKVVEEIEAGRYDVIILNFANCDMVGHTGIIEAATKAVEVVDSCVGKVVAAMHNRGGITLITADHGNAELMVDPLTKEPYTAHTTNEVPFILVSDKYKNCKLKAGILADIAPTILELAGLDKPDEMTGSSLLYK